MLALVLPASALGDTRIILKRDPGLSTAERRDIREDAGVRLIETLPLPRTEVVAAPTSHAGEALRELNADDDVVYAELDRVRSGNGPDPYRTLLWALDNTGQTFDAERGPGTVDADISAYEAWGIEASPGVFVTGSGVEVAVVDSGIYDTHEDLVGQVVDKRNFVGSDPTDTHDATGHGTAISGTIAALRDNDKGIRGVAPDAKLMALRALGADGKGRDSDIAAAFRYAGEHGIRIVNASLGGPGSSDTLDAAIGAYSNTLFVVSAGNSAADNDLSSVWPCNSSKANVICVGASDNFDTKADFSNYGDHTVDLFAPGYFIAEPVPPSVSSGQYLYFSGTSQAAPHVAAVAALMLQVKPDLTADQLKEILLETADAKPAFAGYSVSGARVNAAAAVAFAQAGGTPPDGDADGVADAADACPTVAAPGRSDGCPLDRDSDGKPDAIDNCDLTINPTQGDADRDGVGDACDPTPRGPDVDHDGKPALDDRCPTVYGTGANGCPVPKPTNLDRDGDGFYDAADRCPAETARTLDGCPLPAVTSLSAKSRKRRATITVRTSRAATVKITVQRKRGRRWVRVARKTLATSPTNRARLRTKRVRAGRYRVTVVLSSGAGRTAALSKRFRVR